MTVRVIGVGNRDRGDDAAGLVAVRLLRRALRPVPPHVSFALSDGDAGRLLDAFHGAAAILVVDAVTSGAAPGALVRLDARRAPLPASLHTASTHGFGLAEAIELGRALGRLPERLTVWGIEAGRFDLGARLSGGVRTALPGLVARLRAEL